MLKEISKEEALAAASQGIPVWIVDISEDPYDTRNLTNEIQALINTEKGRERYLRDFPEEDEKTDTTAEETPPAEAEPDTPPGQFRWGRDGTDREEAGEADQSGHRKD